MGDDTFRERQDNEFMCLQSVYDKELRDLRLQDAWRVWRPPEFVITLAPQQSTGGAKEIYAQIDLHIKCTAKYPDEVPTIFLENEKGLSTQNVTELQKELCELASDLRGEVMILELAQKVQTCLHRHNKPQHGSFYDEMLCNRKRKEEQKAKETKHKEDKAREAIQEEIIRKQEELREDRRQQKEQAEQLIHGSGGSPDAQGPLSVSFQLTRDREYSPASSVSRANIRRRYTSKSDSLSSQESQTCDHFGTTQVKFSCRGGVRVIQRGKCLGHSLRGSIVYSGMDVATGELVVVTEWTLTCTSVGSRRRGSQDSDCCNEELNNFLKQLATIEQELASLIKLQHRMLVHYLGMSCVEEKGSIVVSVLQEFVSGGSLSYHLLEGIPIQYDLLQHYTSGILDALSFLHRNSVVHKDLRDTSVFIEHRGLVRISDYSLDKRLYELYCSFCKEEMEDLFPPSPGRGGKKADVYRLGILCLSLVKGYIVNSITPEIPPSLPAPLRDFLVKCLIRTEQERWSADQLLDHSFLKPLICQEPSPLRDDAVIHEEPNVDDLNKISEIPDIPAEPSGSRLRKEFDIITWLGRGGFGDVYKVRNKLDGGVYAIKRISLNPSNKQLNRKITREVKLLSRLNHENVVRYFNSWMETAWMDSRSDTDSDADEVDSNLSSGKSYLRRPESSSFSFCVDKTAERNFPQQVEAATDLSISFENSKLPSVNDSSDDEDEEDEDVFGTSFMPMLDASDDIVFEAGGSSKANGTTLKDSDTVDGNEANGGRKVVQFMYIQMEFCDKSTLRNAMDDGLYKDKARVWRLFREIVEGLAHIHQQGMIHRDLKPVNIFLDSSDQVKIGDFGLATTNVLCHAIDGMPFEVPSDVRRADQTEALHSDLGESDGTQTSWVGTVLYISPEVADPLLRNPYNEKVDVYSLGIIFFEMCYHPLSTAMERVKVLDGVRRPEITFPNDFNETVKPKEASLIRWLLDHDPCKRPTTHELLQSSLLPPPQMEEAKLQEVFRHTISNPQSKIYKHMISSLLEQEVRAAANVTYDMDVQKGAFNNKAALTHQFVMQALVRVFEKHGAIPVHTPLLMPKSDLYKTSDTCVCLVDHGGGVVSLPYDLRVPFSRFVVKNNIMNLKRFYIASVYRERKVFGCHPRALHECAFDIVTPSPGSLLADAEVLAVIWEIISEFQPLRQRNHILRLNHSLLLKGILLYCNVPDEKHLDVCAIFTDANVKNFSKGEIQTQLIALGLADQSVLTLHRLIEMESPVGKLGSMLRSVVKRRSRATPFINQGIKELETVVANLEFLGIKPSVVVAPNLVYGAQHFSGIVFQFACELKMKKRRKVGSLDVLAAGGRYDQLISRIRSMMDVTGNQDSCQSAVGVSIAVDKLVSALLECDDFQPPGAFDVLVCAVGSQLQIKEKSAIVSKLWNASISAHVHYDCIDTLEEVQELCHELRAAHIVILKDGDIQHVKLRSLDVDRFTERIVLTSNLVEVLQKLLMSRTDVQEIVRVDFHRPDRIIGESCASVNSSNHANITFATLEKLTAFTRRRHEAQILPQVTPTLQLFSAKVNVDIVVVDLNSQVLTTISCHIQLTVNEKDFEENIGAIIEKHPRHKKQLMKLGDQLYDLIFEKK